MNAARVELLQPVDVVRDDEGFWSHPLLPDFGDDDSTSTEEWRAWLTAQHAEAFCVDFEADASEELQDRYFEQGDACAFKEWQPSRPDGDGWFVLGMWDTEDGPCCYWLRHIDQGSNGGI